MHYKSLTLPEFWDLYRRLPADVRAAARLAYETFQADPTNRGLRFKRLSADRDQCSVRINKQYRAVGRLDGDTVTWEWIGTHAEFDRLY